jgi:hypothetical protein
MIKYNIIYYFQGWQSGQLHLAVDQAAFVPAGVRIPPPGHILNIFCLIFFIRGGG